MSKIHGHTVTWFQHFGARKSTEAFAVTSSSFFYATSHLQNFYNIVHSWRTSTQYCRFVDQTGWIRQLRRDCTCHPRPILQSNRQVTSFSEFSHSVIFSIPFLLVISICSDQLLLLMQVHRGSLQCKWLYNCHSWLLHKSLSIYLINPHP